MIKCTNYLFVFLFAAALWQSTGYAQEYKFSHITSEQGLSTGVVNCVLQDSKGFMWFGTQDGLNKYDGYSITVFKHISSDSNSLSNNNINCLFEDNNKTLWIGTDGGGLEEYNLLTGMFIHHHANNKNSNSIASNNIRAVVQNADGILWIGTDDGLSAYNKKTNVFTTYRNGNNATTLSGNKVWSLHQSKNETLWIGTYGNGLCSYDKKTERFTRYENVINKADDLDAANIIRTIYEDDDETLWLGTHSGILLFDTKNKKYSRSLYHSDKKNNSLSNNQILGISKDSENIFWIATYGGGIDLYKKETERFTNLVFDETEISGLNNNQIECIYFDKLGTAWAGTEGGGVNVHFTSSSKFKHYKKKNKQDNTLKSNIILALMQDRDSLLWIGTANGGLSTLNFKTGVYEHYPQLSTASNNSVLSLCEDSEGIIWVGTYGKGLNSYNKKTKKIISYPEFKSGSTATVINLFEDSNQNLWISTFGGGAFKYSQSDKKLKNYNSANGLNNDFVYSTYEDKNHNIWIATDGGGATKYDVAKNIFSNYTHDEIKNSISSNSINCFFEDAENNIWIGTANGLNKLNLTTGHFDSYFEKDGLPNDFIYSIFPDVKGNLWMSTNKGISQFNPKINNQNGEAFKNYFLSDGLQSLEFTQAHFQNKSGDIYFGGVNGFNVFNPDLFSTNAQPPLVSITSFKRFGKEVVLDTLISDKKVIELSWKDNFFSIDFAAMDYQQPEKNKFSFIMEGLSEEWSSASTQHITSYTNLSGGKYVFKVRACNKYGVWNNKGVSLTIIIHPPFWKTKWFYLLCLIIIVSGIWIFIKYRTAAIKRENKFLEEKVKERTKELAEKNKNITSSIKYAKRIQMAILPPLEQIFIYFPKSFIFYKPKDIVSGDFYWFAVKDGKKIMAVVDCTGHGVPGAFMSMIGHNLLNQIIIENGITQPDKILNALHHGVQAALRQGTNVVETSDGMDMLICSVDKEKSELQYAGAFRPLLIFKNNVFEKIEGNKFSIGGAQLDFDRKFTLHSIPIAKDLTVYLSTDGFADQFGGEKGKKFLAKRFIELLQSVQEKGMKEQETILSQTFEEWKGNLEQVDDILVIGLKF